MKFRVENVTKLSGRLGILIKESHPEKILETPLLLIQTKGATIPHLSKEAIELSLNLEKTLLEINVSSTEHFLEAVQIHGKGISNFAGLSEFLSLMILKDPSQTCPSGFHEKDSVPIFTRSGKVNISTSKYMDLVECFQPDIYTTLSDGDSNFSSPKKRITKSVERSLNFFRECIDRHNNMSSSSSSKIIASLVGSNNLKERHRMINEVKANDHQIFGYFLDGIHNNGPSAYNLDQIELLNVVKHSIDLLPQDKLKMVAGCYSPPAILKLIAQGIDIFDTSLAYLLTKNNKAFTFNTNQLLDATNQQQLESTPFIDLTDETFKDDFTPLMTGCKCYACQKSTRAYINHLLNTNELLGPIYLMIHNLHHYLEFFKTIRQFMSRDQLPDLMDFLSSYNWDSLKFEEKTENSINKKN